MKIEVIPTNTNGARDPKKLGFTEWSILIPADCPEVNNSAFIKDTLEKAAKKILDKLRKAEERKENPHHHTNRLD